MSTEIKISINEIDVPICAVKNDGTVDVENIKALTKAYSMKIWVNYKVFVVESPHFDNPKQSKESFNAVVTLGLNTLKCYLRTL